MRILPEKCLLSLCPLLVLSLLCGCAGPGGRGGADSVRVLTADRLQGCSLAGTVHVSVGDRLAQLQAVEGAVQEELAALARRSALPLGGNAIVAVTGIDNGSQSFEAWRCP